MNKIWIIIQREYLVRVRKRSFIIMTLLTPLLMAGLFIVPPYLQNNKINPEHIAILEEVVTPIQHALLAQSTTFDTITSHPQALAQCRNFITSNYPDLKLEPTTSTASGIDRATKDDSIAAIGHPESSNEKLKILAKNIQDQSSNSTRFFVIAPPTKRQKLGKKPLLLYIPTVIIPVYYSKFSKLSLTKTST